jgi:hypothetical protein
MCLPGPGAVEQARELGLMGTNWTGGTQDGANLPGGQMSPRAQADWLRLARRWLTR